MLNLYDETIKNTIGKLSDVIRAEYIEDTNFLEIYAGKETIDSINNIKNQIIYGRRGSGKTHLLRAFQEILIENFQEDKRLPIYIDLRKLLPLVSISEDDPIEFAIIVFKYIIHEILDVLTNNIKLIYNFNEFESESIVEKAKKQELLKIFKDLNYEFNGKEFKKLDEFDISEEELKKLSASLKISKDSDASLSGGKELSSSKIMKTARYISFADISNYIMEIPNILNIKRVICLLDEWSEIPIDSQMYLSELLKRGFITSKFSFKIGAIPNRTRIGKSTESKYLGLEDGGDIFPFHLDNRYVVEINKQQTRDFFNELLYKHFSVINKKIGNDFFDGQTNKGNSSFINKFLANQALREILIASAGIPRDFINLFINAYYKFILNVSSSNQRIGVRHIRLATVDWYKTDKKEQVDNIIYCKRLLEKIINEIIVKKKKTHFLIPQKYGDNAYLQQLIDFRVIHLRKKGYSHKGNSGVIYDVYSVDYGCYTSINVHQSKLDLDFINKINSIDNFREIRRISLEDEFFQEFLLEIGDAFNCPHCGKPVNTNHLAYIKQNLCNNCYEKIDE